jgi:eukaryotic-like serine/threonine-protein kinase
MATPEFKCPQCGASVSPDKMGGLCPVCVLRQSLAVGEAAEPEVEAVDKAALEAAGFAFPAPTPPVERFGDYRLEVEIGRGGMGIIYRAHQLSLNRVVALKMILAGPLSSADIARRLRVEAEAAAGLDHPNVVPIYEVGEHEGQPFYAMRMVEGTNLAKALKAGPFEPRRAAALMVTVARAIQHAHERGVLHRDLKPSNILLDTQEQPHVADFGLAKIVHADSSLTLSHAALGTPSYMAPEQASAGSKQVTTAADVYSLGAILYELLTGRPLFQAETPLQAIQQVMESEPERLSRINPRIDRDLETICLKCLNKEPERRYASAAALADDLQHWLSSEPIQARPVGWVERRWLWCRRKPALATLAGALVFTLVVGSTVAVWRISVARQQQRREAYYSSVALADKFIQDGSPDRAMQLLLQCPDELRHWEWGYLVAQCHQEILTIDAHTNRPLELWDGAIRRIAFDSSGERLVTWGFDASLKVWGASTGKSILSIGDASNVVTSWGLSPARSELVVGTTNGRVRRFDLKDGRELEVVPWSASPESRTTSAVPELRAVGSLAYAPAGASLAAATASGKVVLWDFESGHEVWSASLGVKSPRVFFSTDGKKVIVQARLGAWWLSSETGAVLSSRQLDALRYHSLYVSPDGASQVTIGTAGELEVSSSDNILRRLGTIRSDKPEWQRQAVFSRDSRYFCTGGDASTARAFRVSDGREILTIPDRVYSAEFSPDSRRLMTLMADRRVQVWDLERRAKAMTLRGHLMIVEYAAFSPDGRRIATADRTGVVKVWSGLPGRSSFELGPCPLTWKMNASPDGRTILANSCYGRLKMWDSDSGQLVNTLRSRSIGHFSADVSPDGRWLATAALDPIARLWDLATGNLQGTFLGHSNSLRVVRFSPDSRSLATADSTGVVKLWDVASRSQRLSLSSGVPVVWHIEFNPISDRAVITGTYGHPLVWNLRSGQVEHVLAASKSTFSTLSPDGTVLAISGIDGVLQLYDTSSWKLKESHKSRGQAAYYLAFTADGRRMALPASDAALYGYDAGYLQIWDADYWRELIAISGPPDTFTGARFIGADGRRLVTANGDRMIYQWDAFPWQTRDYTGPPGATLAERIRAYAADYWRCRLAKEQEAIGADQIGIETNTLVDDLCLAPRSPQCELRLIDLSPHYTQRLDAWLYPSFGTESPDFSLSTFPGGLVMLLDVPFDARGVLLTRRLDRMGGIAQELWEPWPIRVNGIQVHQRGQKLHVLQAVTYGDNMSEDVLQDGTVVGSYVWHFTDGTTHEEPIIYGRDLGDSFMSNSERPADLERGRIAWVGDTPRAREQNGRVRLYLTAYANPRPELEISHIDFVSKMTQAAPFLVAMTVEP